MTSSIDTLSRRLEAYEGITGWFRTLGKPDETFNRLKTDTFERIISDFQTRAAPADAALEKERKYLARFSKIDKPEMTQQKLDESIAKLEKDIATRTIEIQAALDTFHRKTESEAKAWCTSSTPPDDDSFFQKEAELEMYGNMAKMLKKEMLAQFVSGSGQSESESNFEYLQLRSEITNRLKAIDTKINQLEKSEKRLYKKGTNPALYAGTEFWKSYESAHHPSNQAVQFFSHLFQNPIGALIAQAKAHPKIAGVGALAAVGGAYAAYTYSTAIWNTGVSLVVICGAYRFLKRSD